jgi:hypothetical protein
MGYFSNLKFGGGSIGMFDNSKLPVGALLALVNGDFRTSGSFAPGTSTITFDPAKPGENANTNKPTDWSPSILIKPLTVNTSSGGSKRYEPGFLPPSFLSKQILDTKLGKGKINEYSWNDGNAWIGHLMNSHLESDYYTQFIKNFASTDTKQRLEESTREKVESEAYSARDYYLRFNDQGTDYFRHGLHIDGYTNLKSGKDSRQSWDGSGDSFRLASFKNTPYENNDPVTYGFELVIDAFSSPLLNGSVEDFISQFSYVSEIASRAIVLDDFKRQFAKIFRTKGSYGKQNEYSGDDVLINAQRAGQVMASNTGDSLLSTYATTDTKTNLYRPGKKAYMSYYLQKVDGLSKLIESNTSDVKKYLTDYNKDVIKLTFLEDLSATMGTLAHLYKLLYWSKPNGKGLIPENLLRFNCDIIVSECRNFNRVRKATKTGDLEIIKDNVSRYIYSLRECQFYFNTMPHDDSIDMGNIKMYGEGNGAFEVNFDYKYASVKLEKWVPDTEKFGQYVGYNNGALWKIGNKGMRVVTGQDKFVTIDTSIPKFYTIGTNTMRGNGVTKAIIMDAFKVSPESDGEEAKTITGTSGDETPGTLPKAPQKAGDSIGEDEEAKDSKKEERKKKTKEALDQFKDNAKKVAVNIAKGAAKFVFNEINSQISIRAKLLEDTINKARNLLGLGGMKTDPKRVYPRPYSPNSFGIFFDVRNELFNFVGEDVAGIIAGGMQSLLPGTQINVPFKAPNIGATLAKLTKSFSIYDAEAKLLAAMQSKGPKMPFFDSSKHSTIWAGTSVNKLFNSNTTFKFVTMGQVKFGGGLGVKGLSFMKPKGTIYSDGNSKPATMLDGYSNPLNNKFPVGIKDYGQIQFPGGGQKYPAPLTQGVKTLANLLSSKTVWSFPMGSIQFPSDAQKYPAPTSIGSKTLNQIITANSKINKYGTSDVNNLQFPASFQKYPAPVFVGNKKIKDILLGASKWTSVPGPDSMSALQFPASGQKYMAPTNIGNATIKQILTSNTKTGTKYGSTDLNKVQFPKAPQKYPAPLTQGSKSINQIVQAGTKWSFPVNNKKFGK